MLAAILATALLLQTHPSTDPANLVAQLGSSRYAQRVAAEAELARLGRSAIPALLAAKESKDLEVRTRSAALIDQIGRALLLESSPVRLDFRDVPLTDVVESIARQSGSKLGVDPAERDELARRRLSLRSEKPLPFWSAVDAACSAGLVRPSFGEFPARAGLEGGLTLLDGPGPETPPVSDSGPFRTRVVSVHYRSEIQLDRPRPEVKSSKVESPTDPIPLADRSAREFFLLLILAVEPRLSVTANGPIRLVEALDDRGQSLLGLDATGEVRQAAGYFGITPSPTVSARVDLEYPQAPGRRIRILRGSIPVIVSSRRPGALDVPLNGQNGRSYSGSEAALTVLDHQPGSGNRPTTVQLAIRPLDRSASARPEGWPSPRQPDTVQERLEILDADGRAIPWFLSRIAYEDQETRLTLTLDRRDSSRPPTTARYHGIFRTKADVAFEFRDLPMP